MSKEIVPWEEQMNKLAEVAAAMEEGVGGGQFFSCKGGNLSWMDNAIPNNEMAVVILDSVLENVYYEGTYNPDNIQAPSCFAFGRDPKEMAPHSTVIAKGNDKCGTHGKDGCCEFNEFGSADIGKGKACSNVRRLAMIPAGTFKDGVLEPFTEVNHFRTAEPGFMKLNVMSVKGYASFVTQVANTLHRPPFGIITKVKLVPDDKSIFRVLFEAMETLDDSVMPTIMKRHDEVASTIDFPYQIAEEAPKSKKKKSGKY